MSQSSRPPPQKPNFRWIKKFCDEYEPISYTIAGILCSGALYTMTARTDVGKTAWLISTALAIVTGRSDILGREVEKGRVAFCTAENPTDLRMRFNVNAYHWRIDLDELSDNLIVSDNRVRPEDIVHYLAAEGGAFALVIIDTWQAFFDGRDPNNNAEAIEFTKRFRPLARLPGSPVVVIAAHPIKNAKDSELIPYGGGGTLNEVDGNFAGWREPASGYFALAPQGKLRGKTFDPIHYRIELEADETTKDAKGVPVKMPVMIPVAPEDVEERTRESANRDVALLRAMLLGPDGSVHEWAAITGLAKSTIHRRLKKFEREKLAENVASKWRLTPKGLKLAKAAAGAPLGAENGQ